MARASLADYLQEFLKRGNEPGYIQHHGYRTVRWTYRQVAEAVFRFARELDAICEVCFDDSTANALLTPVA
jgi:hypothetical protein